MRERSGPNDSAVSPVVGMVLVLGISIVGIAAILYWGLPAIDEMKANVEHKSVESQFQELDATIKELVAGTTEKTAKRWQPTLNRGAIVMSNETEGWIYAVDLYNSGHDYGFAYGSIDGDNSFTMTSINETIADVTIKATRVNSTTSTQSLYLNAAANAKGSTSATFASWAQGATKTFYLHDASGTQAPIRNSTIHFEVYAGATPALVSEAWFVPTGRVDYELNAGVGTKTVSENNGAVITGNGNTYALVNSPPIPPAAHSSGVTRHFARAVVLNGTSSFVGLDRFDVLVTLYSTYTLRSYDCALPSRSDCVESVKVFTYGKYADVWQSYLVNSGRGYTWQEPSNGMDYLEDREAWMGFTLLQSTVQLVNG
ncbi:MAG TPA: hypothetical protein VM370_07415 [Candidatus Thermoplasmatota archaeon]|nr:hypothetical protein [Candidatus Thermoplasmatota archaeon]